MLLNRLNLLFLMVSWIILKDDLEISYGAWLICSVCFLATSVVRTDLLVVLFGKRGSQVLKITLDLIRDMITCCFSG